MRRYYIISLFLLTSCVLMQKVSKKHNTMRIETFTKSEQLPELIEGSALHSALTFRSYENTKASKPYMFVAYDDKDNEIGHILVVRRRRFCLFPPKANRFNSKSNDWNAIIQYIPRGTYNGVRSRHSRLVFKDVNYEKLGKLYKNMIKHPEKRNSSGIVTPYQSQIVIKNPGLHDFELCVDTAKKSYKEFEKHIRQSKDLL